MRQGVRTVQRYEKCAGLPIRRLDGKSGTAVVAFADELEAWVALRTIPNDPSAMERNLVDELRRQLCNLSMENRELRRQIELLNQPNQSANYPEKRAITVAGSG